MANITKDAAYDAVAPDDFASMMDVDRYNALIAKLGLRK